MSSQDYEPDVPADETAQSQDAAEQQILGNLTVEDDPEGTVEPAKLAGTEHDDDQDVR